MFILESNQIPAEYEISMDLQAVMQFYNAPESMLADILLIDEEAVRRTEVQRNDQISDDMLFRLWRFSVKQLRRLEGKERITDKEELLEKCVRRLEKAVDKELNRRTMI